MNDSAVTASLRDQALWHAREHHKMLTSMIEETEERLADTNAHLLKMRSLRDDFARDALEKFGVDLQSPDELK